MIKQWKEKSKHIKQSKNSSSGLCHSSESWNPYGIQKRNMINEKQSLLCVHTCK